MSGYNQNQNNPTGIWQHIWVTLTLQALEQLSNKKYLSAWETLKLLTKEIPPECEQDCKPQYEKITKIIQQIYQIKGNTLKNVTDTQMYRIQRDLPEPLIEFLGTIRKSLFDNGWINKSFGAKPKFEGGGTL
jgi:hypothetical protein